MSQRHPIFAENRYQITYHKKTTAMTNRIFNSKYHQRKRAEAEEWIDDRFGYMEKYAPKEEAPGILHFLFMIFVFFPLATLDLFLYGDE